MLSLCSTAEEQPPSLCSTGPSTVTIYDIHALQEQFYFGDAVRAQLKSAMSLLVERASALPDASIVFPDDGAQKRFKSALSAFWSFSLLGTRSRSRMLDFPLLIVF